MGRLDYNCELIVLLPNSTRATHTGFLNGTAQCYQEVVFFLCTIKAVSDAHMCFHPSMVNSDLTLPDLKRFTVSKVVSVLQALEVCLRYFPRVKKSRYVCSFSVCCENQLQNQNLFFSRTLFILNILKHSSIQARLDAALTNVTG